MAKKRSPEHFRFPCLTLKQANRTLVMFEVKAKTLWSVVQINEKVEDKDEGYQRALSPARKQRIAKFVDEGNVLPTSLLISFTNATRVSADGNTLTIPNVAKAGWVIDGQHRLAGAASAQRDIALPVVAFIGLDTPDQINCFVTINREQKGVPSSLYLELLRHLPHQLSESEIARTRAVDLADALRKDETSPFYQRIVSVNAPKAGQMSLTNFVRRASPHIRNPSGRLVLYNDEIRAGVLNNYYRGLGLVFSKEFNRQDSIFFRTLGFGALMAVFPVFFDIVMGVGGGSGFQTSDVEKVFKKIDFFDFEGWRKRGTGVQAENGAAEDLKAQLVEAVSGKDKTTLPLKI